MRPILFITCGLLACIPCLATAQSTGPLHGRVMQVSDGDTFLLRTRSRSYRVHVADVDAPELDQPYGKRARKKLASMIFRRGVSITPTNWNSDGTITASVQFEDHDIGESLVENGIAWALRDDSRRQAHQLMQLETKARQDRRGLWASDVRVSPWRWRSGQRLP